MEFPSFTHIDPDLCVLGRFGLQPLPVMGDGSARMNDFVLRLLFLIFIVAFILDYLFCLSFLGVLFVLANYAPACFSCCRFVSEN